MQRIKNLIRAPSLSACAVLLSGSCVFASNLEEAADYYLSFAAGSASLQGQLKGEGSTFSITALNRGAVLTFGRSLNDLDDVLTLADIKSYALRRALLFETFGTTADPDRYDLDRDGVATETEIDIFFARDAWKFALAGYVNGEEFSDVKERFDQQLDQLVQRFRKLSGHPDHGNLVVPKTAGYTEKGLDALNYMGNDQLPYMAFFDVDQDQAVSFEEFMGPMRRAGVRADADGDGLIDEVEFAAIERRAKELIDQLRDVDGKYGFTSPNQE